MGRPLLKTDNRREIVLEEPRGGALILGALLASAALGLRFLAPDLWIAPALLAAFALWTFAGALKIHQLHLDLGRRTYRYRRGWRFAPVRRIGGFGDVAGVFLDRYEGAAGEEPGRLRSRLIRLQLRGLDPEGTFVLGFPMGPRIARDKAADYARRLGVTLIDRTAI